MVSSRTICQKQVPIKLIDFGKRQITELAIRYAQTYQKGKTLQFDEVKYKPEQLKDPESRASTQEFIKKLQKGNISLFESLNQQYQRSKSKLPLITWLGAKFLAEVPSRIVLEAAQKKFPNSKLPSQAWNSITNALKANEADCGSGG